MESGIPLSNISKCSVPRIAEVRHLREHLNSPLKFPVKIPRLRKRRKGAGRGDHRDTRDDDMKISRCYLNGSNADVFSAREIHREIDEHNIVTLFIKLLAGARLPEEDENSRLSTFSRIGEQTSIIRSTSILPAVSILLHVQATGELVHIFAERICRTGGGAGTTENKSSPLARGELALPGGASFENSRFNFRIRFSRTRESASVRSRDSSG